MRNVPSLIVLIVVVLLAACADGPTSPEARVRATGELRSDYVLDPVVVVGTPRCDPYLDLNWCQEDGGGGSGDCMTSSTPESSGDYTIASTCPGAGDGSTKPGGGGATLPDGGTSGGSDKTSIDDMGDCPQCGERQPSSAEKADMVAQLSSITCADARQALEAAVAAQTVLVYTQDDGRYGSYDSNSGLIYISRPKHWLSTGLDSQELADTLVHEILHKLLGHTNGQTGTHGTEFRNRMASCGFAQP